MLSLLLLVSLFFFLIIIHVYVLVGKLVATATSICGIIVLAFPISMIVEKFASAQQKTLEEAQLQQGISLLLLFIFCTPYIPSCSSK